VEIIKNKNFEYIILTPPNLLAKIRHWLSGCHNLLTLLETKYLSFGHIKELYPKGVDFSIIHDEFPLGGHKDFYLYNVMVNH